VGWSFLFPVDRNPCLVLPGDVLHLFTTWPHSSKLCPPDFASVQETEDEFLGDQLPWQSQSFRVLCYEIVCHVTLFCDRPHTNLFKGNSARGTDTRIRTRNSKAQKKAGPSKVQAKFKSVVPVASHTARMIKFVVTADVTTRDRFPVVSLDFSVSYLLPTVPWPWGRLSP
jgi:hypothetical protein